MTDNYKACLEKGLKFQDFVSEKLIEKLGIPLTNFSSREYQTHKGENKQGFEIKFDDRFKETGNIYIEVAEKSNPDNSNFVKSGIYRRDNTWLYLIGDYSRVFIFSKKLLISVHESKKFREVKTSTSEGFLLDSEFCKKWCVTELIF